MQTPKGQHLLNEEDLKNWLGFNRRLDLERHLQSIRIPYFYGRGGRIRTTTAAIDKALIGGRESSPIEEIEFL
jgi:hypothetical protein